VLTPVLWDRSLGPRFVITGRQADTGLFGDPDRVLDENVPLTNMRRIMLFWVAGLLIGLACLEFAVAWFGLRTGARWALVALVVQGAAMLPLYYLSYAPYRAAGISIALGELPPFQWVPAALLVPAAVLGWIGTR
jgi:cytochrome c oxidase subunit IV